MKKHEIEKRISEISEYLKNGLDYSEISNLYNMSIDSLRSFISRNRDAFVALGIKRRKNGPKKSTIKKRNPNFFWTDDEKQTALRLLDQKFSLLQIANKLNKSKYSVSSFFRRKAKNRESTLSNAWSEEEYQQLLFLRNSNRTLDEISKILGRSKSSISAKIKRNRIDFKTKGKRPQVVKFTPVPKPTPENTVIQYEYKEFPMPEDSLNIPFWEVKTGQCNWISGGFWDEPKYDSPCCGKQVMNLKHKGMQRSYCEFHYNASLEKA